MKRIINHGKCCFITNERYITTHVHSSRYELELKLKNSVEPVRKEAPKCMLCSKKPYNKEQIEVHYWKLGRDSFKWVECKIDSGRFACGKVREGEFKYHTRRHNTVYSKDGSRYYMEPEKLEDLFNTEQLDVVQAVFRIEVQAKRSV